jgi:hypothetical protein
MFHLKIPFYSWNAFLHRRYNHILLTLVFMAGSSLGILCALESRQFLLSLMRGCLGTSVSIVGLAFALLLPFFAVILAALYSKHSALFPVCFLKCFCFFYCMMGIWLTYGSAGWLVCGLLMLSDSVSLLLLLKLSLRHINGFRPTIGYDLFWSIFLTVGLSVLDCLYIAPFGMRLIKY